MFVPTKDVRTQTVVQAIDKWVLFYGTPKAILSDNGSQFTSAVYEYYAAKHHIQLKHTTAYHPQCNGQVERLHRWLKERLSMIGHDLGLDFMKEDDWTVYLDIIAHAYNTTPNQMTSYAPAEIIFGRNLRIPTDLRDDAEPPTSRSATDFMRWMDHRRTVIVEDARSVQQKYDAIRKQQYDRTRASRKPLEVSEFVFYDVSQKYVGNKRKFAQNFVGPFEVTGITNNGANLQLVDCLDSSHVIKTHVCHVKRYTPNETLILDSPVTTVRNFKILDLQRKIRFARRQSPLSPNRKLFALWLKTKWRLIDRLREQQMKRRQTL